MFGAGSTGICILHCYLVRLSHLCLDVSVCCDLLVPRKFLRHSRQNKHMSGSAPQTMTCFLLLIGCFAEEGYSDTQWFLN